jgi:hypothetical protein
MDEVHQTLRVSRYVRMYVCVYANTLANKWPRAIHWCLGECNVGQPYCLSVWEVGGREASQNSAPPGA